MESLVMPMPITLGLSMRLASSFGDTAEEPANSAHDNANTHIGGKVQISEQIDNVQEQTGRSHSSRSSFPMVSNKNSCTIDTTGQRVII
jgi:hypothetical protein